MGTWADRYAEVKRRSWSMQNADGFSTFHAELMVREPEWSLALHTIKGKQGRVFYKHWIPAPGETLDMR